MAPTLLRKRWFETPGFWAGVALFGALLVGVFYKCGAASIRVAEEAPATTDGPDLSDERPSVDTQQPPDAELRAPPPSRDSWRSTAAAPTAQEERRAPPDCKHAPIRGCAPNKDERGCYHCTRCWRPFYYDTEKSATSVSFTCSDMPDAPLYVEMTDKAPQAGAHRWLVTATFDGGRSEQIVTPNLGGAFFATFRGGRVDLTATLRECPSSSGCSGDVEVTVNARRDDPAPR